MDAEKPRHVVVGVDGSPSSHAALRWAARFAEWTGASVAALAVWDYPPFATEPFDGMQRAAEEALAEAVAELAGSTARIHRQVIQGNAAQALLNSAREADLLVVGSRGRGGFTGALLGSVSQHCAQHSPCPVVIVRD